MALLKFKCHRKIKLIDFVRERDIEEGKFIKSLKLGGVIINKKRVKNKNILLKNGDLISICIDEEPPDLKFSKDWIAFEDDYLLVLNKPQGMTTQGTMCYDINHLYYFVKEYLKGYAGLHHRLDRDTSGLVLFTKRKEINRDISNLFKNKEIKKHYLAIVYGKIEKKIEIDKPIGKIPQSTPKKWWINMPQSKKATTIINPIEVFKDFTLVEAIPKTGRTHQIRVHLASIEHPIVGDKFYNPSDLTGENLMLHCFKLSFVHPVTKNSVTIKSDTPDRFYKFLKRIKNE